MPGTVALITDVEEVTVNWAGQVAKRSSVLYGEPLPLAGAEWVWELAPRMEIDDRHSYRRRVVGIVDVKTATPAS